MKSISYAPDALKSLKRHANVAGRIRRAIQDYAAGGGARTNNVTLLVGSNFLRMRVGDYRVIFVETDTGLDVLKIAPRGDAYD